MPGASALWGCVLGWDPLPCFLKPLPPLSPLLAAADRPPAADRRLRPPTAGPQPAALPRHPGQLRRLDCLRLRHDGRAGAVAQPVRCVQGQSLPPLAKSFCRWSPRHAHIPPQTLTSTSHHLAPAGLLLGFFYTFSCYGLADTKTRDRQLAIVLLFSVVLSTVGAVGTLGGFSTSKLKTTWGFTANVRCCRRSVC